MHFWKILIILKQIKKPTGKFLRVLAKNQLRFDIFEKILKCTIKNLNGKLIFTHFHSHLQGPLSFYTPLEHTKILEGRVGGLDPGLAVISSLGVGGCGLYKSLLFQSPRKFPLFTTA